VVGEAVIEVRHPLENGGRYLAEKPVTVIRMELNKIQSPITLMDQKTYTITHGPSGQLPLGLPPITDYKLEIRRKDETTWHTWDEGATNQFTLVARTAGKFKIRATAVINGNDIYTAEQDLEVHFPTLDMILAGMMANGVPLTDAFTALWAMTLAVTANNPAIRQEFGCYVTLNTATGEYGVTQTIEGYKSQNHEPTSYIVLRPTPPDNPSNPNPITPAVYIVADFHTHPPMLNVTHAAARVAGPSGFDFGVAQQTNHYMLPGLVYDYKAVPVNDPEIILGIPAGHGLYEEALLFKTHVFVGSIQADWSRRRIQ